MLTNKQQHLYDNQESEPIFMYFNESTKKYNFGYVRLGTVCVYATTALRPLLSKDLIQPTGDTVKIVLSSYGKIVNAQIIKIKDK